MQCAEVCVLQQSPAPGYSVLQEKGQVLKLLFAWAGENQSVLGNYGFNTLTHLKRNQKPGLETPVLRQHCWCQWNSTSPEPSRTKPRHTRWELAPVPPSARAKPGVLSVPCSKEHGQITRQLNPVISLSLLLVLLSIILNDRWQGTRFAFDL